MCAVQYVHVPGYSALLLRENFPDLNQPGGLIPESKSWWMGTAAKWNERDKRWTFPSGATITFGYLDRDDAVYQYQGAAYQTIIVDELTQHTEWRYRYLFSRQSRVESGPLAEVPLRMRATTNPGGRGHDWVKRRFVDPQTRERGAVFVPARVADNPSVDQAAYLESLSFLDPLTRAQLLAGDWDAVEGGRFKREWFPRYTMRGEYILLQRPGEARERTYHRRQLVHFLTCDPAASAKTTADYTVVGVWAITPELELLLLDADRFQAALPDVVPRIEAMYAKWGRRATGVYIEAVAANNGVFEVARRTRMPASPLSPMGQDKLVRAANAINLAATGRIWLPVPGLVPGMPLDDIEAELYRFTGNDKADAHDDAVDMVSYAARVLLTNPVAPGTRETAPRVMGGAA